MASGKTAIHNWPVPEETDVPDVAADMKSFGTAVDKEVVVLAEGTYAGRPVPGIKGRIYYATDRKALYVDNGANWLPLPRATSEAAVATVISWGVIESTGTIKGGTLDFTCTRTEEGVYKIIWATEKSAPYAVTCNCVGSSAVADISSSSNKEFVVRITKREKPEVENAEFSFHVCATS